MTDFDERIYNSYGIFDGLEDYLNSGDPMLREWFLVKSKFWPIFLCSMYVFIVKVGGPSFMRDREPFDLRKIMILYNMVLVFLYIMAVLSVIYGISKSDYSLFCKNSRVSREDYTYMMISWGWVVYLLKYAEFADTFFLVLRKKHKLITNLHVIHHTCIPICGWIFFRTEKSGFQAFPILINSVVHIVMYSYYGLAAIGPSVRKYLWWKRYLTILQMAQFIVVLVLILVVKPLLGCTTTKSTSTINCCLAIVFFAFFYNFYQTSVKPKMPPKAHTNGKQANITTNTIESTELASRIKIN